MHGAAENSSAYIKICEKHYLADEPEMTQT